MSYFTVDKQRMKEINTLAILNVIRDMGPISKADISRVLDLNAATVSSNCKDLEDRGIVKAVREGISTGGRKPTLMDLNATASAARQTPDASQSAHAGLVVP